MYDDIAFIRDSSVDTTSRSSFSSDTFPVVPELAADSIARRPVRRSSLNNIIIINDICSVDAAADVSFFRIQMPQPRRSIILVK